MKGVSEGLQKNGGSNSQFDFTVASQWQNTLTVASQSNISPYTQKEGQTQGTKEMKK